MYKGRQLGQGSFATQNIKKSDAMMTGQMTIGQMTAMGTSNQTGRHDDMSSETTIVAKPDATDLATLATVTIDQGPTDDVNPKLWALIVRIDDSVEKCATKIDDISSRLTAIGRGYDEITEKVLSLESENRRQQFHISHSNGRIYIFWKGLIQ